MLIACAHRDGLEWSLAQYTVAALLAFDGVGGVVTNATDSAKRWFHRPGQTAAGHLAFASSHIGHFALFAWLFPNAGLAWFAVAAPILLFGAATVVTTPIALKRPVAFAALALSVLVTAFLLPEVPGMDWVLPVFLTKLLVAHLVPEAPAPVAPSAS